MSKSDASIIAILTACLALASMAPNQSQNLKEQRYPSYRYTVDSRRELDPATLRTQSERLEYREPCREPKGRDESDLCAQWRAAKAGEESALWAKWGFGATCAGIIGLTTTIFQGRMGLTRAKEANEIAKKIGRAQVTAYTEVSISRVYFRKDFNKIPHVQAKIKNSGQSPARYVHCHVKVLYEYMPRGTGNRRIYGREHDIGFHVGDIPSQGFAEQIFVLSDDFNLTDKEVGYLITGNLQFQLMVDIIFINAFDEEVRDWFAFGGRAQSVPDGYLADMVVEPIPAGNKISNSRIF